AEERQAADALEREIAKRKWVYEHRLSAKHIASNPYTRYRPAPAPAAFAANPVLVARATAFLRRELCLWDDHRRRLTHHLRCQSDEGGGRTERGGRAAARGVPRRGRAGGGGALRARGLRVSAPAMPRFECLRLHRPIRHPQEHPAPRSAVSESTVAPRTIAFSFSVSVSVAFSVSRAGI
ncbi:hypothetical protein FIBSPDRAFT_857841, partial [Athelia psychrophila]